MKAIQCLLLIFIVHFAVAGEWQVYLIMEAAAAAAAAAAEVRALSQTTANYITATDTAKYD